MTIYHGISKSQFRKLQKVKNYLDGLLENCVDSGGIVEPYCLQLESQDDLVAALCDAASAILDSVVAVRRTEGE